MEFTILKPSTALKAFSSCSAKRARLPLPIFGHTLAVALLAAPNAWGFGEHLQDMSWLWSVLALSILLMHWGLIIWVRRQGTQKSERVRSEFEPQLKQTQGQLSKEIVRHKQTVVQLNKTKDYLSCLVNSLPTVVIGVTEAGNITHWNVAAEAMTGLDSKDAFGRPFAEAFKLFELPVSQIEATISQGTPYIKERIEIKEKSQVQYMDLTVYPLKSAETRGAVILVQDVSFRVRLENSMVQNEKMVSLGQMAAGLAHEMNNPLSAMVSNVQNIERRFAPGLPANAKVAEELGLDTVKLTEYVERRKIPQLIEGVLQAGDRAAKIVKTMLHFSHAPTIEFELHDLGKLVNESLDLATKTLELKSIEGLQMPFIIRDFQPSLPKVECSASEVQQVLLNILINAAQAIHKQAGGNSNPTITVRLHTDGDHMVIELEDNGPGIRDEIKHQIFEPFFTTKEVGSGTGLGLSVSYFIVKEHHQGEINVFSKVGKGTKFVISLPITQGQKSGVKTQPRMLIHGRTANH